MRKIENSLIISTQSISPTLGLGKTAKYVNIYSWTFNLKFFQTLKLISNQNL